MSDNTSTEQYAAGEKVRVVEAAYADEYHGRTGTLEGVAEADEFRGIPHPFAVRFADGDLIRAARIERVDPASEGVTEEPRNPDARVKDVHGIGWKRAKTEGCNGCWKADGLVGGRDLGHRSWAGLRLERGPLTLAEPGDTDDACVETVTEPSSVDNSEDATDEPQRSPHQERSAELFLADALEPEPLKKDDVVLVWARVRSAVPDSDGEIKIALHRADSQDKEYWTLPDGIVRPDEGQVPPWIEPAKVLTDDERDRIMLAYRDGVLAPGQAVLIEVEDIIRERTKDGAS